MPRYELTYRADHGRAVRRILFADTDADVAELIEQEGLQKVTVRPALRLAAPRAKAKQPAGRAIQVAVESRPTDLRALGTLNAAWIDQTPTDDVRNAKRIESGIKHARDNRDGKGWCNTRVAENGGSATELIEDALIRGALELGKAYRIAEIEEIIGCVLNGGGDMLALRMADKTSFRLSYQIVRQKTGRPGTVITFHNRTQPAAAAA